MSLSDNDSPSKIDSSYSHVGETPGFKKPEEVYIILSQFLRENSLLFRQKLWICPVRIFFQIQMKYEL